MTTDVSHSNLPPLFVQHVGDDGGKDNPEDEPCRYGDWSKWSECEVVCQPVKKGSTKVRQRIPLEGQNKQCRVLEEYFYCDPNTYC